MITEDRARRITVQVFEDIKTKYGPAKTILHGSFAYRVPDENSDIDLLVIKDSTEWLLDPTARICRIVGISDSSCPASSPIVVTPEGIKQRLEIGDHFIEEILARGEILYAR